MTTIIPDLSDAQLNDLPSQGEAKVYRAATRRAARGLRGSLSGWMDTASGGGACAGRRNRLSDLPSDTRMPVCGGQGAAAWVSTRPPTSGFR